MILFREEEDKVKGMVTEEIFNSAPVCDLTQMYETCGTAVLVNDGRIVGLEKEDVELQM